jgi:putative methyltransferase (TIGR04325 family)
MEHSSKDRNKRLVQAVLEVGPVRKLVDAGKTFPAYRRFLNRSLPANLKYRGVFHSFEEANAAAPKHLPLGYDHDHLGRIYDGYLQGPMESDFPVMFWLRELLAKQPLRLFDFGGNTGFSYYAWGTRHLQYDQVREWKVCDLPAIAKAGRELAAERGESRLSFTSEFSECDGFDVLLSAGCLQYVETPISKMLASLQSPPPHLLLNRIPLNRKHACVTLQNIGRLASPYHVFQRDPFVKSIEEWGYQLVDEWKNSDHRCWIPFYPEYSVVAYTGLYFRRKP